MGHRQHRHPRLRNVIEHPDHDLVGVYVHWRDKAGRDAGELCGLDPTGVLATREPDDIAALGADCVLYMPQGCDFDALSAAVEAGATSSRPGASSSSPASMDPGVRRRIEDACRRGASSIHSTGRARGSSPKPYRWCSLPCSDGSTRLVIDEFADLSQRTSPELLFDLMGFGAEPEHFDPGRWAHGAASFGPSLRLVAEALSLALDSVEASGEVAVRPANDHRRRRNDSRRDGCRPADDRSRA